MPGMVLLEAARQAVAWESDGALLRPTAGRMKAVRFTEFSPPAGIRPALHHRTCVFRVAQGCADGVRRPPVRPERR
ncbi:hypothetical protein NKH77_54255 [Streptomyces sp. M19]